LKRHQIELLSLTLVISILTLFYLYGVAAVPFHPDESTYLFMSQDFDTLLKYPSQLFWQPGNENDLRQRYRELDPPLPRYIIGIGRQIVGLPALAVDWNWSKTWQENQAAGALPSDSLLLTGRLAVSIFFPFTLFFIYSIGKSLGGQLNAWLALLLFASNALILLHTRRVMAESLLIFCITFSLWCMLRIRKRPWLVGIPIAMAFCAKPTAAPLIILGMVSVAWPISGTINTRNNILRDLALYVLVFTSVTFLLNPFIWSDPIQATWGAIINRQVLMDRQAAALQAVRPEQVLDTIPNRIIGMIAQLFFTQPAIADIGNYIVQTKPAEFAYFSNPMNNLFRNFIPGGILTVLSVVGFMFAFLMTWRQTPDRKRIISLILLGTILQFMGLLIVLHISWQRYYLPLIPFTCLWMAFAITQAKNLVIGRLENKTVRAFI
jgi:4-amino-4-deoxy-L-arabinose transferase-like glycosyltransferase